MVFLAAIPPFVINAALFVSIAMLLISFIWFLVVAAQRSIWWLLGSLLLPLVGIILVVVEPRARSPFFVNLLACAGIFGSIYLGEDTPLGLESTEIGQLAQSVRRWWEPTLEERKANIRDWKKELEAKKSALPRGDAAAKAGFDAEYQEYSAELESVKAAIKRESE